MSLRYASGPARPPSTVRPLPPSTVRPGMVAAKFASDEIHGALTDLAMGQNPNRTPSEHPNPHSDRLQWVVYLPQNGTIGFDPQPSAFRNKLYNLL